MSEVAHLRLGDFGHILLWFETLWRRKVARIQNKLLTGTITVIDWKRSVCC